MHRYSKTCQLVLNDKLRESSIKERMRLLIKYFHVSLLELSSSHFKQASVACRISMWWM